MPDSPSLRLAQPLLLKAPEKDIYSLNGVMSNHHDDQ